ncbi:MAG: formate dehydrogenase subunit alpha [Desulfovermiculus sp.]|nr:formate dehydrogenase subunit alpha [Desulfovermiculus sp.]
MDQTLHLNGQEVSFTPGQTILEVARENKVSIPTLCHMRRAVPIGSCRVCVVEIKGAAELLPACSTPANAGMQIHTHSPQVLEARREILTMLMYTGHHDCPICDQGGECRLQDLVYEYGVRHVPMSDPPKENVPEYATPNIRYWPERCILCLRCVTACNEVLGIGAIAIQGQGNQARVVPSHPERCVSCGECLFVCPTGALTENLSRRKGRPWLEDRVMTTCTYCGCGCQLFFKVLDNQVIGVTTDRDQGVNRGSLCVKGRFGYEFISSPHRLKNPLIRKNGTLKQATWDEALSLIASRMQKIISQAGPDSIGGLASPKCTNEDIYLFQKLMRAGLQTNNVDQSTRLCHAATLEGLEETLGHGAMTNPISDVLHSQVILVTGANTAENQPIFSQYVIEAVRKHGAKLIVVDPRRIPLTEHAHIWLQPKPGTDIPWINGFMHIITRDKLHDVNYIKQRTSGFKEMREIVDAFTPELVSSLTGIAVQDLEEAARLYGSHHPGSILYSTGIEQHAHGKDTVQALVNLALTCGNLGVEGGGIYPLYGQNNVQGACDMGALPGIYPGYQEVLDAQIRSKFAQAWNVSTLPEKTGLTAMEMMAAARDGQLKALYVLGENPMLSFPDQTKVQECLQKLDFLVVQDIFLTETGKLADVVLPATCFAEKNGTFTNSERKVQRVRKAVEPRGQAQDDSWIIAQVGAKLDYPMEYAFNRVLSEINALVPDYAGITSERLEKGSVTWPCPAPDHPGTPLLHSGNFARGRGLFSRIEYQSSVEEPDSQYPYMLSMGSVLEHHQSGTMTREGTGLSRLYPEAMAEINPHDADQLGISNGDTLDISSRRGKIRIKARVCDRTGPKVVFVPVHFRESPANILTDVNLDQATMMPELKVCAVSIQKVA